MGPCEELADDRRAGPALGNQSTPNSRIESAARRLEGGMPARVARQDAAMERRPARTPLAQECLPKGSIQDEALSGAPSPSGYAEGGKGKSEYPAP